MVEYATRLTAKPAPESVRRTLIEAGCLLSAYELIKLAVVDGVRDFYARGFQDGRQLFDEGRYQQHVLSRNPKSRYRASCAWLVEMGALTADQAAALENIHVHRQEIAHELPKLLVDPDFAVKTDLLLTAVDCVRALGVFWGRISIGCDPEWDGQEVADEDIKSGSYLLMEHLISVAGLASEPQPAASSTIPVP
jgi:hypothetical protein